MCEWTVGMGTLTEMFVCNQDETSERWVVLGSENMRLTMLLGSQGCAATQLQQ